MDIENLDKLDVELPSEFDGLPVFVVGGAVRDAIRGVPFEDIDLMVAETSPDEMRERGFREIDSANNDTFGVFQDSLKREVALAREESPSDEGENAHTAFDIEPVPADVRAREAVLRDLERRDFTVNAMAFDARWETLHDPRGGVQDLKDGILRAVNADTFKQDPLRILRGARFAARLDAEIDDTTKGAMWESVAKLPNLPQERVRMEMEKALVQADEPSRFFRVLEEVAALDYTFPELYDLMGVSAGPDEFHKEGDTFDHTMLVLDEMSKLRPDDELAMLMALAHDLGKAVTAGGDNHGGHGKKGVNPVREMMARLGLSNAQTEAMKEACRYHMRFHDVEDLRASTVVEMWQDMSHFHRLWDLALADSLGREPKGDPPEGFDRFHAARQAVDEWTGQRLIDEGYDPQEMGGENFGNLLHQKRVERMRELEG
jgi:tRNA nucleotidyltransferase (CCA-adding enzyme)